MVKNLPTMQETQVQSLEQEYPLKEDITHSNILAWKIPQTENLAGYSPWNCEELDMNMPLTLSPFMKY